MSTNSTVVPRPTVVPPRRRRWLRIVLIFVALVILAPLVVLVLYYGVHPQPIIDASAASIDALIKGFDQALAVTKTAGL